MQGPRNTIKLQKDISFKNPWIQIYSNTTIDTWYVGDFSSASYFITVEYDSNHKECMHVLVIARPAQATYSIYGRTSIDNQLVTLSATVSNSQLTLSATANTGYSGAKLSFSVSYNETMQPLSYPTTVTNLPPGSIPVPPTNTVPTTFGQIAVSGQSTVYATSSSDTLAFVAGTGISLTTNSTSKSVTITSSFPFFQNIQVSGQPTLIPATASSSLTYSSSNGISLTTNASSNTVNIGLGTLPTLSVSGSSTFTGAITASSLITANTGILVNNGLTVNNGATFNNGTTVNTSLAVNGTTLSTGTITSNSNITSTIDVSGLNNYGAFNYGNIRYTDVNILASFTSSPNSYNQIIIENNSSGTSATANLIVSNNQGTATTNYGNLGINSSGWTGTLGTSSINAPGVVYLASASSDLVIGTFVSNNIRFVTNSGADAVTIDTSNTLNALQGFKSFSTTTLSPASANVIISPTGTGNVTISPSGTGTVAINPTSVGTIDNMTFGSIVPRGGTFTTVSFTDSITVTNNVNTSNVYATGLSDLNRTSETVFDVASGATVSYNFQSGSIFYHTSNPGQDWTASFLNLPTTSGRAISMTIVVPQGSTAYKITGCTIEGLAATIKWAGGFTTPIGNANKTDIWAFTLIRRSGGWTVLGSQNPGFA